MFTRNHKEKLEDVNDTLREVMEIAREEDSERDLEMRTLLKSAIQTIDVCKYPPLDGPDGHVSRNTIVSKHPEITDINRCSFHARAA